MRKKSFIFAMMVLLVSGAFISAQQSSSDSSMTVEEAYLNSMEGVILKEMIQSEGRDSKFVALQVIEEAIESGKMSPEIQQALDSLASVGLTTLVRENGRVMNNFPDVRMKACSLLGKIKNEQSKDTLMKVMYIDNEPAVIMEAVRSLGELGYNNNDEVINMINWINQKFDTVNPTSSLALEILNTYEKLVPTVKDRRSVTEGVLRIANNFSYVTPVRTRAMEILKMIMSTSSEKE